MKKKKRRKGKHLKITIVAMETNGYQENESNPKPTLGRGAYKVREESVLKTEK